MPDTPALATAKEAVQEAENLMHRRVAEAHQVGQTAMGQTLTVRDGCIIVDALVRVMEAIEANHA